MVLYLQRWLKICLFNLLLVATIGVILRYKIAFSLPFIDQKHLLHGHSHFAFAGWITQALMVLLVAYLAKKKGENTFKKYRFILNANLVTAYAMLIAFPIEGPVIVNCIKEINGKFFIGTKEKGLWLYSNNKLERKKMHLL